MPGAREENLYMAKLADFVEKVTAAADGEERNLLSVANIIGARRSSRLIVSSMTAAADGEERNLLSVADVIGARRASRRIVSSIEQKEERNLPSVEERNLLSVANKNVIGAHRASRRIVSSIEHAEVEAELIGICAGILMLLDARLIPFASADSKVFYPKMKGDRRSLAELKTSERKDVEESTPAAYKPTKDIAVTERYEETLSFVEKVTAVVGEESVAYNSARRASRRIETELIGICAGILKLLDARLIPYASAADLYHKMKGDHHRSLTEFKIGSERKDAAENTPTAYKSTQLSSLSSTLLGFGFEFRDIAVAEQYEEMLSFVEKVTAAEVEERNFLLVAYKNVISGRRTLRRIASSIKQQKENSGNGDHGNGDHAELSSTSSIPPSQTAPVDCNHPTLKGSTSRLRASLIGKRKRKLTDGDYGPKLLLRNLHLEDVELFDPYSRETLTLSHQYFNDFPLSTNQDWLMMATATRIHFLNLSSGSRRPLRVPIQPANRYRVVAGAFTAPPFASNSIIVLIYIDYVEDGFIAVMIWRNDQWKEHHLEYRFEEEGHNRFEEEDDEKEEHEGEEEGEEENEKEEHEREEEEEGEEEDEKEEEEEGEEEDEKEEHAGDEKEEHEGEEEEEYEDQKVFSVTLHDDKIWWFSDKNRLYVLEEGDNDIPIFNNIAAPSSVASLMSLGGHLYFFDLSYLDFSVCYEIIYTPDLERVEFLPTELPRGYDIFLITQEAGLSFQAPNSVGQRIFVGVQTTDGVQFSDCSMFDAISDSSFSIKDCQNPELHHYCGGAWFFCSFSDMPDSLADVPDSSVEADVPDSSVDSTSV